MMLENRSDPKRPTFAVLKNTLVNPSPESVTMSAAKLLEIKEFDAITKVKLNIDDTN